MLQGKVRAAVRWLAEQSKGSPLKPDDMINIHINGVDSSVSVADALKSKDPLSHPPHSSTLLRSDELPYVEITGAHITNTARHIQGSVGPGGCDSTH